MKYKIKYKYYDGVWAYRIYKRGFIFWSRLTWERFVEIEEAEEYLLREIHNRNKRNQKIKSLFFYDSKGQEIK